MEYNGLVIFQKKILNKRNFVTHFTERLLPTDCWSMHCKLAYYYVFWPRPRDMLEVAAWCIFILEEGSLNSKEEVTGPRNANIVSRRMFNIASWSPALLIFIVFETRLREVLLAALHSAATLPMKLTINSTKS